LLYTSKQGGQIALDRNGKKLTGPVDVISTADPREPLPWRQVHHWNLMRDFAIVRLPKDASVLTLRIVTQGNMNLACLDFHRRD
jgi:hypothetical protein